MLYSLLCWSIGQHLASVRAIIIGKLQRADEELLPIFNYLENDVFPSDEKQARKLAME